MRYSWYSASAFVAFGIVAAHPGPLQDERQSNVFPRSLSYMNSPKYFDRSVSSYAGIPRAKIASVQSLPAQFRPNATRVKIRYGPYVLPPKDVKGAWSVMNILLPQENGALEIDTMIPPICNECMILAGTLILEYEDGSHASAKTDAFLHHAVLIDFSKRAPILSCPASKFIKVPSVASLIAGGSSDEYVTMFLDKDAKVNSGHYVGAKDKIAITAQAMNYKSVPQTVYLAAELEYVPGKPADYLGSYSVAITVGTCAKTQFNLPSKIYSKKSEADYIIPTDGYIVNFKGHLHDGGTGVQMMINGKEMCNSLAVYGAAAGNAKGGMPGMKDMAGVTKRDGPAGAIETIARMTECSNAIPIRKGDMLTLAVNYDLVAHPLRMNNEGVGEQVMGIGVVTFAYPIDFKLRY